MLHGLHQLGVRKVLVAVESNSSNLDSRAAVYVKGNPNSVLDYWIFLLKNLNLTFEKALFVKIFLYDVGGRFDDIIGELGSPLELKPLVKILLLAIAYAVEQPAGNSRTL